MHQRSRGCEPHYGQKGGTFVPIRDSMAYIHVPLQADGVIILKSSRGIIAIVIAEYVAPVQAAEAMKVVVPVIEALER